MDAQGPDCPVHSLLLQPWNQPPAHATQTTLSAQFTAISGGSGRVYGRSLSEVVEPQLTVRLAGGDLRSEYGAAAPPESCPRIAEDPGLQRSRRLHPVGDGRTLAC